MKLQMPLGKLINISISVKKKWKCIHTNFSVFTWDSMSLILKLSDVPDGDETLIYPTWVTVTIKENYLNSKMDSIFL